MIIQLKHLLVIENKFVKKTNILIFWSKVRKVHSGETAGRLLKIREKHWRVLIFNDNAQSIQRTTKNPVPEVGILKTF